MEGGTDSTEQRGNLAEQRSNPTEQRGSLAEQRSNSTEQRCNSAEQETNLAEQRTYFVKHRGDRRFHFTQSLGHTNSILGRLLSDADTVGRVSCVLLYLDQQVEKFSGCQEE